MSTQVEPERLMLKTAADALFILIREHTAGSAALAYRRVSFHSYLIPLVRIDYRYDNTSG